MHSPHLYVAAGHAWCHCTCGWRSRYYDRAIGAHYEFGTHLVEIQ